MKAADVIAERFAIERPVASGGMGSVFRAFDRLTGEHVAVKMIREGRPAPTARFVREGRILADLRHPGIVRYVAHGTTSGGELYLAMEWLRGESLSARLAHRSLAVREALVLAERAAEALGFAHERGIVHRDVKPANLFLQDGLADRVKLLDFGIARVQHDPEELTSVGMNIGTPAYMAPEQATSSPDIDARADVFALASVLFRCLAGRPPFVGDQAIAVLAKVVLEDPPRLSELRPDLPPELDDLVARALSRDRAKRPKDGSSFAEEIHALGSVDGTGPTTPGRSRPAISRGEQRLLCVVLASRSVERAADERTADPITSGQRGRLEEAARIAVRDFAARAQPLADGSIVVTVSGAGAATDLAARAARCAIALRAVLADEAVAVATGRGVVDDRMPIGEGVDRAVGALRASPREAAVSSAIRLDELTAGLLGARFEIGGDSGGLLLLSERADADVAATLLGRRTPFVGRQREIATLGGVLDECRAESVARAVLVSGRAGVGKSRLREEFLERTRRAAEAPEVWIARGDPMRAGAPFGMLGEAIRRAAGIQDGEPPLLRHQKLRARVSRNSPAEVVDRVTEFLGELVGVPVPREESVQLRAARSDPMLMGDQMRRAWEDLLAGECVAQPLLLVLEDLQWGDLPTVKFVDAALRRLEDVPFLVLAFARSEIHDLFPKLWESRGLVEIQIGDLAPRACERLVRHVLGDETPAKVVSRIVERADGNAFYLEELIRAESEGKGGSAPGTVLAMVQARLEELPVQARRVLRAASVFGRVFRRDGLEALLGRDAQAGEWLGDLVDREIVRGRREEEPPGDRDYVFRHDVVREVAYGMLTDEDRVLGHRLASDWLLGAGEGEAAVLAEHLERGGTPDRAVPWYMRAAEQALEGNAFTEACEWAERGARCGASGEDLGHLRLVQAEAHRWQGNMSEAEACGAEALESLGRGTAAWCRAAEEYAMTAQSRGNVTGLVVVGEQLSVLLSEGAPSGPLMLASARLAAHVLFGGRYDLSSRIFDGLTRARESVAAREPRVAARIHVAFATRASFEGDPATFLECLEAAIRSFADAGDLRSACVQQTNSGFAMMEVGLFERAESVLGEALAAAAQMGLQHVAAAARHNLGLVLARLGRVAEGEQAERKATEAFGEQGHVRLEASARVYLALILKQAGRCAEAEREARTAVEALEAAPPARCFALGALASVILADRPGEAVEVAREAMSLLESLGKIDEGEALVRLAYAEALHATGDVASARSAISAACDRLRDRAGKIRLASLRATFLERVPENVRTLRLASEWLEAAD